MYRFKFNHDGKLSKVKQIVRSIAMDIEKGVLEKDTRLPSINEVSEQYSIARDTIEKAYKELREEGYIISVAGKGYYVVGKKEGKIKILLIFNKLSSYKKIVYESFLETLGDQATVDLQVHHYDLRHLKQIIGNHLGNYHYYVIMPHFYQDADKKEYLDVIKSIPVQELMLLDKNLPGLEGGYMAVFQDFRQDIYMALQSAIDLLEKYRRLTIVFPPHSHHPPEIVKGVHQFCKEHKKEFSVIGDISGEELKPGVAYIVTSESDLAKLIKEVRKLNFKLGSDIGIISFNETVFKELLDITVITTDFEQMGRTAANMILSGEANQVRNPFYMIRRNSL